MPGAGVEGHDITTHQPDDGALPDARASSPRGWLLGISSAGKDFPGHTTVVAGIKKPWRDKPYQARRDFRKNLRNHGAPQARPEKEKARHECERVRSPSCRSINISLRLRQRTSHFSSLRCSEWSGWRRVCVFRLPVIQRADSAADSGIALADRSFITIPGVDGFFRGIRGGIWRDMAGYGGIPGDTGRYREIPGDTRYGRIRADTGRYGEIRGDAMRCKEIRGDTVRYCRDTSRYRKKAVRTRAITLLT